MSSPRLVRGTKGRLFACLGVLTLFAGVLFLYHSTRVELDEVRNSASKCHQEQDSLAAQVQVMTENKLRLEKSLQQEKIEHRQTKEELQSRMNDEQQIRDRENLENVNKYKALQQQYKLLQNEHEDLNEHFNKLKSEMSSCTDALIHLLKSVDKYKALDQDYKLILNEQGDLNEYITKLKSGKSSCTDALSRLESVVSIIQQQQLTKAAEAESLRVDNMKLRDDNTKMATKLVNLQVALSPENKMNNYGKENSLVPPPPETNQLKGSSTKETNGDGADQAGESAGGNQAGFLKPPHELQPAAQSSSTATQEQNLMPARPAQPAPLQAAVIHTKNGESFHNGLQGVLPAPLDFGSFDNVQQQGVLPLPYRQQRMANHEASQNNDQIPLIAPVDVGAQSDVLPVPPMPHRDYVHIPNINHVLHNMNPFQGEPRGNIQGQDTHIGGNLKNKKTSLYNVFPVNNIYHANNHVNNLLKPHDPANAIYDVHDINKLDSHIDNIKKNGLPGGADIGFIVQNNQFARPAGHDNLLHRNIAPPINRERLQAFHQPIGIAKNVKLAPLDGDVNEHGEVMKSGADDFDLGPHPGQSAIKNPHQLGKQEIPHGIHYNYQGEDYDKEEPDHPPHGDDDDDVDLAEEIANQAHPPKKLIHRRFDAPQHHAGGVMVNPR